MQIQPNRNQGGFMAVFNSRSIFRCIFYVHLVSVAFLVLSLGILWSFYTTQNHDFKPMEWFDPLFTSTGCAGIVALAWLLIIHFSPSKAIKAAFWLSPMLTVGFGVLQVSIGSSVSLAIGIVSFICALIQSLYGCWASPRLDYAIRVLSVSTAPTHAKCFMLVIMSIFASVVYSCYMLVGIGGAIAKGGVVNSFLILLILLSLAWTMQVTKNMLQTVISHVRYMHFTSNVDIHIRVAFTSMSKLTVGSICMGSAIVPMTVVVRGLAQAMSLVAGDTNEFLFSCVDCFSGISSKLIMYGNRWAFVQVGVYNKGFIAASFDTWEMFKRTGMEQLIDSELTGTFSFLCGLTGGAISSIVGGSWALAIHKSYATQVSIYTFLIGYFICRVAMAWPQACVSAYYVGYAEHPESSQFDDTIADRIQQLQTRSQA